MKTNEEIREEIGTVTTSSIDGTCLRGTVKCSYNELVTAFGEPASKGDDYKTDAEWDIRFPDGTVSTVYNWKNGKNYCGPEGLPLWTIGEWNVGGYSGAAPRMVQDAIAYVRTVIRNDETPNN